MWSPLRLRRVWFAGTLGLAGCAHYAHYESQPIAPADSAAALDARSLGSPDLRQFLVENLGHDFPSWPPATWDFETLSWVAFHSNPSLGVARAQWAAARAGVAVAGARPNPTVSLVPGYNSNAPAGTSPWLPMISFDIPITTAGKRGRQIDVAELTAEAARQAVFASAWQVRGELRHALIDLEASGRRAAALGSQADLQRHILSLLEERRAQGAADAGESSAARLALARAEGALADAGQQAALARQRVASALGLPVAALAGARLEAPSQVPWSANDLARARRQSLQSRADVLAALARYEASQRALALEVARQYPDLHLGPGYQYDQGLDKWTLGLTFEVPLFNHNEGPVAQAQANRAEAAAEFTAVQARAISEIDGAAAALAEAEAQAENLRRLQVEISRQDERVQARLAAGGADRLEADTSRLDLAAGEFALADAQAQAALAAGQLEDALQVPLPHLSALIPSTGGTPVPSSP
jgi:outer membrane protein, heavy metal efflux system